MNYYKSLCWIFIAGFVMMTLMANVAISQRDVAREHIKHCFTKLEIMESLK